VPFEYTRLRKEFMKVTNNLAYYTKRFITLRPLNLKDLIRFKRNYMRKKYNSSEC